MFWYYLLILQICHCDIQLLSIRIRPILQNWLGKIEPFLSHLAFSAFFVASIVPTSIVEHLSQVFSLAAVIDATTVGIHPGNAVESATEAGGEVCRGRNADLRDNIYDFKRRIGEKLCCQIHVHGKEIALDGGRYQVTEESRKVVFTTLPRSPQYPPV